MWRQEIKSDEIISWIELSHHGYNAITFLKSSFPFLSFPPSFLSFLHSFSLLSRASRLEWQIQLTRPLPLLPPPRPPSPPRMKLQYQKPLRYGSPHPTSQRAAPPPKAALAYGEEGDKNESAFLVFPHEHIYFAQWMTACTEMCIFLNKRLHETRLPASSGCQGEFHLTYFALQGLLVNFYGYLENSIRIRSNSQPPWFLWR